MAKVGIDNYRFSEKNKWRLKVWTELARRVKNPKTARVLYLAGEQDLDREIAKKKGFRPYNMIAVEMDDGRAKALRQKGVTTIKHNIMDILYNWPKNHKVDVIIADFCFGLESDAIDLYDSLDNAGLINAELLINFQRGRDASSNTIRKKIVDTFPQNGVVYKYRNKWKVSPEPKHRAFQYAIFHAYEGMAIGLGLISNKNPEVINVTYMDKPTVYHGCVRLLSAMNCKFFSYKSNRVYMDSCVMSHFTKNAPGELKNLMIDAEKNHLQPYSETVKRSITAALAVSKKRKTDLTARTM